MVTPFKTEYVKGSRRKVEGMLLIRSQVNTRKGVSTLILILNIKGKTNVQVRAMVETSEFGFLFVFDYFANLMILFVFRLP